MVNAVFNQSISSNLLQLAALSRAIGESQQRIATGRRVNDASDDPVRWARAAGLGSDQRTFDALRVGLALGRETVGASREGAEALTAVLEDMRATIVLANAPGADRDALETELLALKEQYASILASAGMRGVSLLRGGEDFEVLSSVFEDENGRMQTAFLRTPSQDFRTVGTFGSGGDVAGVSGVGTGGAILPLIGTATVDFAAYTPTEGDSFRITIEGVDYEYIARAGDTASDVSDALFALASDGIDARGLSISVAQSGDDIVFTNNSLGFVEIDYSDAAGGTPAGFAELATLSVATEAEAAEALTTIDALIDRATDAAARLGSAESRFDIQTGFLDGLDLAHGGAVDALTAADVAAETILLEELNLRYQLALAALGSGAQLQAGILQLFA